MEYRQITINGKEISYSESGSGQPMLLLHGFASGICAWQRLLDELPRNWRCIAADLYSMQSVDAPLAPAQLAEIIKQFIAALELDEIVLVGHSTGGTTALLLCFDREVQEKIAKLVLIDCIAYLHKMPDFLRRITDRNGKDFAAQYAEDRLWARFILSEMFFDLERIDDKRLDAYSALFNAAATRQLLLRGAEQTVVDDLPDFRQKLQQLQLPVLIIWGREDHIIAVSEGEALQRDIPRAELTILPDCGHLPHEEYPRETAILISNFVAPPSLAADQKEAPREAPPSDKRTDGRVAAATRRYKLRLRRLFDRWNPEAVIFLVTLKLLQLARFFGIKADEDGWRKASRVYLRKEHSKFCLAVFRLNSLAPGDRGAVSLDEAKARLIARLGAFIKDNAVFHWGIDWHRFSARRRHNRYVDIVETIFDHKGRLLRIIPHFDPANNRFPLLTDEQREILHNQVVRNYNESLNVRDKRRLLVLRKRLTNYITDMMPARSPRHHLLMRHYVKRILNATCINFEVMPNVTGDELLRCRLKTPNFKRRKHPGGGLLNILCRFDSSLRECDLWFQYHHVPVDGMPMQEMLEKLKGEWGTAGIFQYPALSSPAARPEIFYFGNKIFRARIFCDFTNLLTLRKRLNKRYAAELGGEVSFPCLLLWSLTQQDCFRELKFSMPVDNALLSDSERHEDRSITLLFIRPSNYYNPARPFNGFADFVQAFNQNLYLTRLGKSESYQFLELCAITHPLFYSFVKYFMKNALKEVVGTVGITIIRNAEMFVSPLTDLQLDGFMAFGNCRIPTVDGKFAGAISICGSKEHIRRYVPALQEAIHNIEAYVKLPE